MAGLVFLHETDEQTMPTVSRLLQSLTVVAAAVGCCCFDWWRCKWQSCIRISVPSHIAADMVTGRNPVRVLLSRDPPCRPSCRHATLAAASIISHGVSIIVWLI